MSAPLDWLGRLTYRWLQQFKIRHGLVTAEIPAAPQQDHATAPAEVPPAAEKVLLHVACGADTIQKLQLKGFRETAWDEVRLDANAEVEPDLLGSMVDMSAVADAYADVLFSSHGIEHLYWHEVPLAFAEFKRTLKDDGFAVITCPDVQAAAEMIAQDRMFDVAYQSAAGPITPFDILYSYRPFVRANPQWMSHHCGFTLTTLIDVLKQAGFASVLGLRRPGAFDLWVLASKSTRSAEELQALAADFLPQP